jgi:hypothetical protein
VRAKGVRKIFTLILVFIVVFAATAGGIYGMGKWIDSRIEKAINNKEFIKKIADEIFPPFLIFDDPRTDKSIEAKPGRRL